MLAACLSHVQHQTKGSKATATTQGTCQQEVKVVAVELAALVSQSALSTAPSCTATEAAASASASAVGGYTQLQVQVQVR